MSTLAEIKRLVEERGLTPCHAFFATFLAAFSQTGVLTQGVINMVASHAAEVLRDYLHAMGLLNASTPETLVESVLKSLEWGEYRVSSKAGELVVEIVSSKCRYCPRGVGRAEIPGTACPLPKLLEKLLQLEGFKAALVLKRSSNGRLQALVRSEGRCIITYRIS